MSNWQTTPRAARLHIALLGMTNVGKSSLINALTGQEIALVSRVKGTTTDPVYKAMEMAPLGPLVFIDTAGLDDLSELGELRKKKTLEVLTKTDLALLICDARVGLSKVELEIRSLLQAKKIPFLVVLNKIDLVDLTAKKKEEYAQKLGVKLWEVSASTGKGLAALKEAIIKIAPAEVEKPLLGDLINKGDCFLLVIPLDKSAPKGRLILPQQQVLREILDEQAIGVLTQPEQLKLTLANLSVKPRLVITDSQVFQEVAEQLPLDFNLTSFSILFARQKGDLAELCRGASVVKNLKDGDRILIAEACTHHRQDDDLGTVKIPQWLRQKTNKKLFFSQSSGYSFPADLEDYALIVHCAGCMLNRQAMLYRIKQAQEAGVPLVNYGVLIAFLHDILERALQPFL